MWKAQPFDVYQQWITDILEESSDKLNDWESTFIDNIQVKITNGWQLTENQAEKLEQMYVRYTS